MEIAVIDDLTPWARVKLRVTDGIIFLNPHGIILPGFPYP
jgi:hypothetical protein